MNKNYIRYGRTIIHVIFDENNEIWFNAMNTTTALSYKNNKAALRKHVNRYNIVVLKHLTKEYSKYKQHPNSLYINEAGLYSLMMRSRMPKAIKFAEWITEEVLPSIRKFGSYKLKQGYEKQLFDVMDKINYLTKENEKIKRENVKMRGDLKKETFPIGGLVYVIDYLVPERAGYARWAPSTKHYSTADHEVYRIGKTNNMHLRKKIYDTHTLHKHKVVYLQETDCPPLVYRLGDTSTTEPSEKVSKIFGGPVKLESCVRSVLYDYLVPVRAGYAGWTEPTKHYRYGKKDFYKCRLLKIKKAFKSCLRSFSCVSDNQIGGGLGNIVTYELYELKMDRIMLRKKIKRLESIL